MAKYVNLDDVIEHLEMHWGYEGLREDLYELQTADVAEVRPELRKAVKLLEENYDRGLNSDYVNNPVAWALYQTWKQMDGGAENA